MIAHDPANFDAWRGLERVELARGALEEAWKCAQEAARLRPGFPAILADQAWILARAESGPLAQPKQALELAEQALARGGEQPALLDAFALAAAANGDFARAIPALEKVRDLLREVDPGWSARASRRLAACRAGRVDRETPR
ncbi:MAG: hypothetical protein IPJ19_01335 [Planctomycetes bacterium]|nr:hypothetical protein [Planctomycetota bacterium]